MGCIDNNDPATSLRIIGNWKLNLGAMAIGITALVAPQAIAVIIARTTPIVFGTSVGARAEQLASANQIFRNGPLTNVGRALTKHPNVIGESGNILKILGGAQNVNAAAAQALETIMQNGTTITKMTKTFGQVIDYTLSSGIGARFSAITNKFIGFLGRGL